MDFIAKRRGLPETVARLLPALLLLVAVSAKLMNPNVTLVALRETYALSRMGSSVTFVALIAAETLVFMTLVSGSTKRALILSIVCFAVFTLHLAFQAIVAPKVNCGCGLSSKESLTLARIVNIVRNAAVIVLQGVVLTSSSR